MLKKPHITYTYPPLYKSTNPKKIRHPNASFQKINQKTPKIKQINQINQPKINQINQPQKYPPPVPLPRKPFQKNSFRPGNVEQDRSGNQNPEPCDATRCWVRGEPFLR